VSAAVKDTPPGAMIKLFSVKDKQEKEAAAKAAAGTSGPKQSPGEIRLAKDISELTLAKTMGINFPDGAAKITHFVITLKPDEGYYKGGRFVFEFTVPTAYPHEPPKVKCTQKIYHPNVVRISHPTHSASLIGPITLTVYSYVLVPVTVVTVMKSPHYTLSNPSYKWSESLTLSFYRARTWTGTCV
jgi:hypothetical protein